HRGNPANAMAIWLHYAWPSPVEAAIAFCEAVVTRNPYRPDEMDPLQHDESDRARAQAQAITARESKVLADWLRDIFGPFPFFSVWMTIPPLKSTVVGLARSIYERRAFSDLPILADALEEAGCAEHEILDHCRGPGIHVPGCWVVDLVLGAR